LREIIEIYLKDFFKIGIKKVLRKYEKARKLWDIKKMKQRGCEFLRQLSLPQPTSKCITVKYDENFLPYSIKYFITKEILLQ
jgi:uncharacterized Fe-S radical SAM superfamily protein PflX